MGKPVVLTCLLVSLSALLIALGLCPVLLLEVRFAEGGGRVFCSVVASGEQVTYLSVNSIFNAPVQESWEVRPDGLLAVVQVVSTPAVMGYYGIESYTPLGDEQVRAVPRETRFREIRLKVGPRGRQRLGVGGRDIALYQLVPEATTLVVAVRQVPRVIGCH